MNNFVNIPDNFDPESDFFSFNPQLKIAFDYSSDWMWAATLYLHPDDDVNKMYRYPEEERLKKIKAYFKIDWEDPSFPVTIG